MRSISFRKTSTAALATLLIVMPFFYAYAGEIDDLKQEIGQKGTLIEELQKQAEEYEKTIVEKQGEATTLELRIVNFNREIQNLEREITINEQSIGSLGLQIIKAELQIHAHQEAIIRNKARIGALIREIYANDDEEIVELILKYETLAEFSNFVQYRDTLQQGLSAELGELKSFKETLENDKESLEENKITIEEEKRGLDARQSIVAGERNTRETLLRETRNQETRYQKLLSDTELQREQILREVFELEDALRRTLDPSLLPKAIPGILAWPTEGILTQGYGCIQTRFARSAYPTCDGGSGGFHNGIDIAASTGTEVRSAKEGTVVAVESSPYAYGYWVAVLHDNGLVTLYPHLSYIAVSKGQQLGRGEVLGYMGSTGFSTGSHLHFTVYAPRTFTTKPSRIAGILPIGATLNPFDYLP